MNARRNRVIHASSTVIKERKMSLKNILNGSGERNPGHKEYYEKNGDRNKSFADRLGNEKNKHNAC